MLLLALLLAATPTRPSPDPRSPSGTADAPSPNTPHRQRDDDYCAMTWQIDGGITWMRLTWDWRSGAPVNPLDGCDGSGLLRLEDGAGGPIGFVRVTRGSEEGAKVERWRWLRSQAWPSTFFVRPMRYDPDADLDDSRAWEAKANVVLINLGDREPVLSEHWTSAYSVGSSFTWTGFSSARSSVPKEAGDVWFVGTPGGGAEGPTLYLRARSGEGGELDPIAWYATQPHDVHLRGVAPFVSFRRGEASEVPDSLYAGR